MYAVTPIFLTFFKKTSSYNICKTVSHKIGVKKIEPVIRKKESLNHNDAMSNAMNLFVAVGVKYFKIICSIMINVYLFVEAVLSSDWMIIKEAFGFLTISIFSMLVYPIIHIFYVFMGVFQSCTTGYAVLWLFSSLIAVISAYIILYTLLMPINENKIILKSKKILKI